MQDQLERALSRFAAKPLRTVCAGRTDTAVHALNQVVHFDTDLEREPFSWVRGPNTYLPDDVAVQWAAVVGSDFHARNCAQARRYTYVLLESPVRPALETQLVGWTFRSLDGEAMHASAQHLLGTHDFSAFRSAECQAKSPIKELRRLNIRRHGAYWLFEFEASAFLHHMVRNIMGCLVAVGTHARAPLWMRDVLEAGDRNLAAPTFPAAGLYFVGPSYDASHRIPTHVPALDWLPGRV